jgi:signal peptidase I
MRVHDPATADRASDLRALFLIVPLVIVFVGLLSTFYFTYQTAYVDGISMEPTLLSGELVLVTRGYEQPLRGDVVVVELVAADGSTDVLVKRIVGLPGDEVLVEEGQATVNGKPEQGEHTVYVSCCDLSVPRQIVPDGMVFLLGDNRPVSEDSRLFGTVPIADVRGKVVAVFKPVTDARIVD